MAPCLREGPVQAYTFMVEGFKQRKGSLLWEINVRCLMQSFLPYTEHSHECWSFYQSHRTEFGSFGYSRTVRPPFSSCNTNGMAQAMGWQPWYINTLIRSNGNTRFLSTSIGYPDIQMFRATRRLTSLRKSEHQTGDSYRRAGRSH